MHVNTALRGPVGMLCISRMSTRVAAPALAGAAILGLVVQATADMSDFNALGRV